MIGPTQRVRRPAVGVALVVLAAGLWGTLGTLYTLTIDQYRLPPLTVVFYRAFFAALALALLRIGRGGWRIGRADRPLVIAYGLLGVTVFYVAYIYAVLLVGVTTAVVLLYTAPAIVAVLAWRFLGERWTRRKGAALGLTLVGVVLVAGAYNPAALGGNALGLGCGLLAGATYALYSIFGKLAHRQALPLPTLLLYTLGIGSLGLLAWIAVSDPAALLAPGDRPAVWAVLLMLGTVQTLVPIAAYTLSLHHLDAGVASICAMLEPMVAGALAVGVLHRPLGWPEAAGAAAILVAVGLLTLSGTAPAPARQLPPPVER
ncbi:MAG: DMT family transporter [Chloroflexota bacterium]|nr:DMT family transporter [Chloroflexota bacterium]